MTLPDPWPWPFFPVSELTHTEKRDAAGRILDNPLSESGSLYLPKLAGELTALRSLLGCPLKVTSGYRCWAVNLAAGGKPNSAHLDGRAADFVPLGVPLKVAYEAIWRSGMDFDQLIFEHDEWIHFAIPPFGRVARRQALMIGPWTGGRYLAYVPAAVPSGLA